MGTVKASPDLRSVPCPQGLDGAMCFELSESPVHLTRILRPASSDEFAQYLAYMTQVLALKRPFAIVIDASIEGSTLTPAHLRALAAWISKHSGALRTYCVAYALVRRSIPAPVRFATAMILSVLPIVPMPYRMFGDRESALAWTTKIMDGRPSEGDLQSKGWPDASHPD